jgi:hypothetical protein
MTKYSESILTLQRWLERDPQNHEQRLRLADWLLDDGRESEALEQYAQLALERALPANRIPIVGQLAAHSGHVEFARECLATAQRAGVDEGVAELRAELAGRGSDR